MLRLASPDTGLKAKRRGALGRQGRKRFVPPMQPAGTLVAGAIAMNPVRRRRVRLRGLACALLPLAPVAAADTEPQQTIVVTASRFAQVASAVLADLRVIDREQIDRAGAVNLPELLQAYAGVEITATGGPGQVSGVFIRGSNSGHVVLLIDGVRINSASSGTNAFENLPLAQIERIEVLRGPASSLYGADAIGGVIQIFTRDGGNFVRAKAAIGSEHTRDAAASLGREFDATRVSLQAGWREVQARSATNAANLFSFNPDDDPYRNANLGFNVSHEWQAGQRLALRALYSDALTHFDAGPGSDDVNRQRLTTVALESRNRLSNAWSSLLRLARGSDHLATAGGLASLFATDQDQLLWQNDFHVAATGELAAGLEWRREQVASDTQYVQTQRRVVSVFGSYAASLAATDLAASLRHDDNSQFGARTTATLGAGWRIAPQWQLSASTGTAFRAPSFNDLYFPPSFGFAGNPNLSPERSVGFETSARYLDGPLRASVTLFQNRITDLISVDPTFTTVANVNRARIRGATLRGGYETPALGLRGELTLQQPVDADTGKRLVRRAREHGTLGVDTDIGAWRVGADLVASGARFDSASNDPATRMGGYGLVHLSARHGLGPGFAIAVRVTNATDKHYELAQGYNTPRRQTLVALEVQAP
jgi:vitamin B12 transporter